MSGDKKPGSENREYFAPDYSKKYPEEAYSADFSTSFHKDYESRIAQRRQEGFYKNKKPDQR